MDDLGLINLSTETDYTVFDKGNLQFQVHAEVEEVALEPAEGEEEVLTVRRLKLFIKTESRDGEESAALSGNEHFHGALRHLSDQFDTIRGEWTSDFGINLGLFNEAVKKYASLEEAARRGTWTGRRAEEAGYSEAVILSVTPPEPPFSEVEVEFRRPQSANQDLTLVKAEKADPHFSLRPDESGLLNTWYNLIVDHLTQVQTYLSTLPHATGTQEFEQPALFWLSDDAGYLAYLTGQIGTVRKDIELTLAGKEASELSPHTQKAFADMQEIVRACEVALANAKNSLVESFSNGLFAQKLEYKIRAIQHSILPRLDEHDIRAKNLLLDLPKTASPGTETTAIARPGVTTQQTNTLRDVVTHLSNELKFELLGLCIDLPGMTVENLKNLESCSPADIVAKGLAGFVHKECLQELQRTTLSRITILTGKLQNIEPAKGLSLRRGRR